MELTYDWRGLSRIFHPQGRKSSPTGQKAISPAYFIVEKGIVLAAFSESEDLSDWLSAPIEEATRHFQHRDCVCFERADADAWFKEALALPHFHEQAAYLRKKALESVTPRKLKQEITDSARKEHFLLEAFGTWWSRALPSEFGFLLRLETQGEPKDFVVILRKGTPLSFFEPDFSSFGRERASNVADAVKYLSEKHLVPVQAMVAKQEDWERWHTSEDPWREVARGLKTKSIRLVPFRWDLATMAIIRAYLGL